MQARVRCLCVWVCLCMCTCQAVCQQHAKLRRYGIVCTFSKNHPQIRDLQEVALCYVFLVDSLLTRVLMCACVTVCECECMERDQLMLMLAGCFQYLRSLSMIPPPRKPPIYDPRGANVCVCMSISSTTINADRRGPIA